MFWPLVCLTSDTMKKLHLGFILLLFGAGLVPGTSLGADKDPAAGHDNPDCRMCHHRSSGGESQLLASSRECLSCHRQPKSQMASNLGFHQGRARDNCLQCHAYHESGTVTTTRGSIRLAALDGVNAGHCQSCHDGKGSLESLSEAHLVAAKFYHEEAASLKNVSPSQACLNCHSSTSATDWQLACQDNPLEFREHSTHPFEVGVVPGQGSFAHRIRQDIDPRIPLFDGTIQCQTCHQLASETPDLIVAFDSTKDLCLGCHQFRDQPQQQQPVFVTMANP